jgi:uncharacterized phage-associated protein
MPTASVLDVANYFLAKYDPDSGDEISNLKVQKLVYYAQGFHLALTGEPLFEESIEAWRHGPVVPTLYHALKEHGDKHIPASAKVDFGSILSSDQRELLDEVYETYGQFSAWKLRSMTHNEAPWKDADARGTNAVITHEELRDFFLTRLVE